MTTVSEVMTADPISISPEMDVGSAFDLMDERKIRHVLVVDSDGKLLGVLSHRDLMRIELMVTKPASGTKVEQEEVALMRVAKVDEIYTRDPETVDEDTSLAEAGTLFLENKFGCLPVVREDVAVGILTEADFVKYVVELEGVEESGLVGQTSDEIFDIP